MAVTTKSERVAAEAFRAFREGDLRRCIHDLVDYADLKVKNARTANVFKCAIDTELAELLADVSAPDERAPRCAHCGSYSTYVRADGDVGCNDCPGIMGREVYA